MGRLQSDGQTERHVDWISAEQVHSTNGWTNMGPALEGCCNAAHGPECLVFLQPEQHPGTTGQGSDCVDDTSFIGLLGEGKEAPRTQ